MIIKFELAFVFKVTCKNSTIISWALYLPPWTTCESSYKKCIRGLASEADREDTYVDTAPPAPCPCQVEWQWAYQGWRLSPPLPHPIDFVASSCVPCSQAHGLQCKCGFFNLSRLKSKEIIWFPQIKAPGKSSRPCLVNHKRHCDKMWNLSQLTTFFQWKIDLYTAPWQSCYKFMLSFLQKQNAVRISLGEKFSTGNFFGGKKQRKLETFSDNYFCETKYGGKPTWVKYFSRRKKIGRIFCFKWGRVGTIGIGHFCPSTDEEKSKRNVPDLTGTLWPGLSHDFQSSDI